MQLDVAGPAHAYIIVGDGAREQRVLKAAAPKYNHIKILRVVQIPIRSTRLANAIKSLVTSVSTVNVARHIIVIDKERFGDINYATSLLRGHGFEILATEELIHNCWKLRLRRGHREVTAYIVVMGEEKGIEESIAKLIKLRYNEDVRHEKEAVDKWLREHGVRDLVEGASKREFGEAFPRLARALKDLAEDP